MRRREFIAGLAGAAAVPLATRAQQGDRVRRIGVILNLASDDPEAHARNAAFLQRLQELGWTVGRNVEIDYRWGVNDGVLIRRWVADLIALAPDVILANGAAAANASLEATRIVPIVFVNVTDPVSAGLIESLARPGGNATGFTYSEYGLSGKWLELLKEVVPGVRRVAVLRDPSNATGIGELVAIQSVAPALRMEVSPVGMRDAGEIERAVAAFARAPNGGLIVTASGLANQHRNMIITLAARHRLPAVYPARLFATSGGLISYGPDIFVTYRLAAGYVDRILKGERPADLAVQAPTKNELVINLKTAKALGLTIPETLLATADEVIQ
jgi:putative ABC transport system substrate-binding protein